MELPNLLGEFIQSKGQGIQRNRPGVTSALARKTQDGALQAQVSTLPIVVQQALAQQDIKRTQRGQMPLTDEQTVMGGLAATGAAATPVKDNSGLASLPSNAARDVTQIVKSIPHLPGALVGEVKDIADGFGDDHKEARDQNLNPLAEFLSMPGVRMIPGSYIAKNIVSGNVGDLVEHPVLNALDALPIASKLAKGTGVVKAAEAAAQADRMVGVGAGEVTAQSLKKVRPLKVLATKTLDDAGAVVPNRLGDLIDRGMNTAPVQAVTDRLGGMARETSRTTYLANEAAAHRGMAPAPDDVIGQMLKEARELAEKPEVLKTKFGLEPERAAELSKQMRVEPKVYAGLADNEKQFIDYARKSTDDAAEYLEANHPGSVAKVGGEWFSAADAGRITKARDRAVTKAGLVYGSQEFVSKFRKGVETRTFDAGIMDELTDLVTSDAKWGAVETMVKDGDLVGAAKKVNQYKMYANENAGIWDQRMFKIRQTLNEASNAHRTHDALVAHTNPARFDDLITRRAAETYVRKLDDAGVTSTPEQVRMFIDEGVTDGVVGFNKNEWSKVRSSTRNTWQQMKAAGEDPVFLSRVPAKRANAMSNPGLTGATIPSLQSARARVSDLSPSVDSAALSISQQAFDIIRHEGAKELASELIAKHGVAEETLRAQYLDVAKAYQAKVGGDMISAFDHVIAKRWTPFDPTSMSPFSGAVQGISQERFFLPRQAAETLKQAQASGMGKMTAVMDPITKAWRISLLPLSPRWHLYNIIGGAAMMSAEVGPQAFRQMGKAREIMAAVKNAGDGAVLPRAIPAEIERVIGSLGREESAMLFKEASTAGRLFRESQAARLGKKAIKISFDINGYFDDMYRVMGFLEGEQLGTAKFIKQGFTDDAAKMMGAQEGVLVSRKILQDVASLTPFERGLLRPIAPFYSWLSHIMRFAFAYPFDHPWRTAIVASGSRIIMEDMGDGASLDMLDMFSWGEPDAEGKRKTLRIGGMNPFGDVGKMMTLAGWLGSTNPVFATAAQALGFDPQQGGIDLYPNTSYNEATGGLQVNAGNPVKNLALNSLPHLGALLAVSGQDADFNAWKEADPDAATMGLLGKVGIPSSYKRWSKEGELVNNELKREDQSKTDIAEALKTGDFDTLRQFFSAEMVDEYQAKLESGALDQYIPAKAGT